MAKLVGFFICILAALCSISLAQQDSACLNQLVPCLEYINSKKTPSTNCCKPLKSLIKSDPDCLCSMLGGGNSDPTKQQPRPLNTTQAVLLPARCGEKTNAAMCTSLARGKNKPKAKTSSADFLSANGVVVICLLLLIAQTLWASIL